MSSLERLVRPNVAVDVRPHPPFLSATERAPTEGQPTLAFGSAGDGIFTVTQQLTREFATEAKQEKEISRTVDVIRVKNEDDPEQHVDVESVTNITVMQEDGITRVTVYQADKLDPNRTRIEKGRVVSAR